MSQAAEIEVTVQEAEAAVKLGEALQRLQSNRDFKKIVIEGYFEKEAIRLVHSLNDPNVMHNASIKEAHTMDMHAISCLRQYFHGIRQKAEAMEVTLADSRQELERIRGEEGGDE